MTQPDPLDACDTPLSDAPLVVLGVCASISAYKAVDVVRQAQRQGMRVQVVPTTDSLRFVGQATWEALTGRPATADLWEQVHAGAHIELARHCDLVAIAPCSAHQLAAMAAGAADTLLSAVLLATTAPVVAFPAMHTQMWQHPATQANVEVLRQRGVNVVDPDEGPLAAGDVGVGRLPEPSVIVEHLTRLLPGGAAPPSDLAGCTVLVSAGGTREPLDPVRYLGNASSGRQGYAIAQAALARGAQVHLVAANVEVPPPAGAHLVRVSTAADLHQAMRELAPQADVVVMAAAVADWRPAQTHPHKQRKDDLPTTAIATPERPRQISLTLVETPDILAQLCAHRSRPGQVVVGFAAETLDGDQPDSPAWDQRAWAKLARKGADLLVVNPVGAEHRLGTGFATADNQASLYRGDGHLQRVGRVSKLALAHQILDQVVRLRS